MTLEISLRGATNADLLAILALARQAALPEVGIAEAIDRFSVAVHDGVIVGSAGLEAYGRDALLRTVVVAPASRGTGVGRELVEDAFRRARTLDLRSVFLLTTTAREFFGRLGFEPTPRASAPPLLRESWEFKTGCPDTAVLMRRDA